MIIECVPDLRERMLAAVEADGCKMDMDAFAEGSTVTDLHPCGTACCLAGWAINCHPQGKEILGDSSNYRSTANRIFAACFITPPDFFDGVSGADARAMTWLRTGVQCG